MGEKPTEADEDAAKWSGHDFDSDKDEVAGGQDASTARPLAHEVAHTPQQQSGRQASAGGSAGIAIGEPGTTEKAAPERPPGQTQRAPDRINLQGT